MSLGYLCKRLPIIAILLSLLAGCAGNPDKPFQLKTLAKSELDLVIDIHMQQANAEANNLMKKLYLRNPRELRKAPPGTTLGKRQRQLFGFPRQVQFNELGKAYGAAAITLAFNPDFEGDRVFAFMAGVAGMIHASYNYQEEFFILDEIDQQRLYNSARNLETASWMLNSQKDSQGNLLILSNSTINDSIANHSYARLFGKLIANQDTLALIIADKNNRVINKVVQGVASTIFLPI
ncbi:MAG: hypothetical protein ACPG4U_11610 [Pseudomonadales bacterium]